MAMLITATQLWNRIGACASMKAIQKEIMLVPPLSVYVTCEQPQNWDFSPGKECVCVCVSVVLAVTGKLSIAGLY